MRIVFQLPDKYILVIGFLWAFQPLVVLSGEAEKCAVVAAEFMAGLSGEQTEDANWPFDNDKRRKWTYYPNVPELDVRSEGLPIKAMTDAQRVAAHKLIECGLSSQGYQKASGIMRMDDVLGQTDLYRPTRPGEEAPVGTEKYWLAVFGTPGGPEPWGWQLEGHHLALNFAAVDGEIVFAPAFMGADPARVQSGRLAGWRILGDEVDAALALVASLNESQREQAVLAAEIPERLFTSPGREDALQEYAGISASDLNASQLKLLNRLIDTYVNNGAQPIAEAHQQKIRKHMPANTWFAWMGPLDADRGIYYRVHSPALLIEFVTARNRQSKAREPNPNHVHSIFAYPGNNYGDDLLRRHYEQSPDHQHE